MSLETTHIPWWERSETRGPRWGALLVALALVSILHYTTSPERAGLHVLYQRLYYGPIIVGAYWFGLGGGLATAVAAALAYAPHIHHEKFFQLVKVHDRFSIEKYHFDFLY